MQRGTYIGERVDLKGEPALIRTDPESSSRGVLVQFDNLQLKESHGWWSFYNYEFKFDSTEES